MKAFVIDQNRCNGCYGCQVACKDEHCGNEWLPYQKSQPDLGHFWMKLQETTHGQVPRVKLEYLPLMCQQCDECPVVEKYPEIAKKREDGLVTIDPTVSEGMRDIVDLCPYGAIYWNEDLSIPQKCDGCAHLVDAGEVPHCVELCATGALRFGDEEDFAEEIACASQLNPEFGTKPRVYVLNAPGLFIGGGVWDSSIDEIVENAEVTLDCPDGSQLKTESDDFGDFWFRQLAEGEYSLSIHAEGYEGFDGKVITLDKSLNVGDFDLASATI